MQTIQIDNKNAGQRIDKYIRKYLNNAPLSYIYKLFRKKDVKVNGKKVDISYIIKENDIITIYIKDDALEEFNKPNKIAKTNNNLNIIYEDENLLIINKEAGILVHEGQDNKKVNTLNNDILYYLKNKGEYCETDIFTPSCVHRLDRNTSGLIIAAKNLESSKILLDLFKDKKQLQKEYITLVKGKTPVSEVIDKPLLKIEKDKYVKVDSKGLPAITSYTTMKSNNSFSLLKVNILTGRTHQIRVHMASIGHPIINDDKYGDFNENKKFASEYKYQYQFLHSYKITFNSIEGKLAYLSNKSFIAPLDTKKENILKQIFS